MRKNILFTILSIFLLFITVGCNFNDFLPDDGDTPTEDVNDNQEDSEQKVIYNLAVESGYKGSYEDWLESIRGDEVVIQVSNGEIQWKYSNESLWKKLISLKELTGEKGSDGKNVEFKVNDGFLQWRYVGEDDINWRNLLNLSTLTGADGQDGKTPEFRVNDGFIQWKYSNETTWTDLISVSTLAGEKGEDGLTPEFRASETHILWKYTIESDSEWRELIALDSLKGEQGPQGVPGQDGYTPVITIGSNGNWYVDDVDTGIKAQGTQGDPGIDGRSIVSITLTSSNDNVDTYTILYSDDTTSIFTVTNGKNGLQGIQGVPGNDGHTPIITIQGGYWYIDGVNTNVLAEGLKGETGNGISSIVLTKTEGLVDTYTIMFTNGSTTTFAITNGKDGEQGIQGIQGEKGEDGHTPVITIQGGYWYIDGVNTNVLAEGLIGETGNGISSIVLTSSEGLVDTYTITFTNGSTTTFAITNGKDGVGVESITIDERGHLKITLTSGVNLDLGNIKGPQGEAGVDGTDIESAEINANGELVFTLSNGKTINAGKIVGSDGTNGINGVGIKGISFNAAGELIIILTDDEEINCGPLPLCEHMFNDWITNKEATCTSIGVEIRNCIKCGYRDYNFVDAIGHAYEFVYALVDTCVERKELHACISCSSITNWILN